MRLVQNGQQVIRAEKFVFLAVELDFGAAIFAAQHAIAHLDFPVHLLAFVVQLAGTEDADDAFLGLFLGRIGDDDAALFGFLLFDRFNEETVAEGFDVQCNSLFLFFLWFDLSNSRRPSGRENLLNRENLSSRTICS